MPFVFKEILVSHNWEVFPPLLFFGRVCEGLILIIFFSNWWNVLAKPSAAGRFFVRSVKMINSPFLLQSIQISISS